MSFSAPLNAGRGLRVEPETLRRLRISCDISISPLLTARVAISIIVCQTLDFARYVTACHHLEDHVDAAPAGQFTHYLDKILGLVVDAFAGTKRLAGRDLVW